MTNVIIDFLIEKGFDAMFPGVHQGDCLSPYVVVRQGNGLPFNDFSTTQTLYDLMCYVPGATPSMLNTHFESVKTAMKELCLVYMIRPTYTETTNYYDPDNKAHMRSVQYVFYKRK